jgi:methyl-accepting chemotaxis protein
VVAGEVKALARQAASAGAEIDSRIAATQQEVERVQKAFDQIRGFIEQIGLMQHSIVQAVAQQTATTQKIGESI